MQAGDGTMLYPLVARTFFFNVAGNVSQAVRSTSRGARPRIFIKYGTVRLASNFAVSHKSHPKPFCTMSSESASRRSDNFTTSGKNIFARAPRIKATHAALRCHRSGDFAQPNTSFTRPGFATTAGAIR